MAYDDGNQHRSRLYANKCQFPQAESRYEESRLEVAKFWPADVVNTNSEAQNSRSVLTIVDDDGIVVAGGDQGLSIGRHMHAADSVRIFTEDFRNAKISHHIFG